jgi:sugar/nucleoside kinase (ribokinase family)
MRPLGVIGHLARDVVEGGAARIGGGPWHAARGLRVLRRRAVLFAKCGEAERSAFVAQLAALGTPVVPATGGETTAFSMSYDEHARRTMTVEAIGEPWSADEVPAALLRRVEWLHVAPLLRGDFDAATLAALARGRRVLFDAQGLVRRPEPGPLVLDDAFDPELLRHVTVLKLAEEEARAIVGDAELESLRSLGVPEVIVTFGLDGSLVITRDQATHVPAHIVHTDPTGAGDAYSVAYVAARADGHAPLSAARQATGLVAALLSGAPG